MINPAIQLIIENLTFKKTYDNFFKKIKIIINYNDLSILITRATYFIELIIFL
jgi:hypothetical protein